MEQSFLYSINTDTEEKTLLRRFVENLDWVLLGSLVYLVGIGLLTVYSATLHFPRPEKLIITQGMSVLIGFIGMVILASFNYQLFRQFMYPAYAVSIMLLVAVLVAGTTVKGTRGWFNLGYFSFQPVELAKIAYVLVLAGFLDSRWRDIKRWTTLAVALLILLGQIFFIMLQPDFSSTLSYFPLTLAVLFVAGVEPLYLIGIMLFSGIAVGIPLAATFFKLQPALLDAHPLLNFLVNAMHGGMHALLILLAVVAFLFFLWWFLSKLFVQLPLAYPILLSLIIVAGSFSSLAVQKSLKDYQRKRLIVFINPEIDPLGSGYNIIQSKIAIGSGRFLGKGVFSGTQSQLGFLPEQHTDFIFSVVGEETGFFVSQLTILVYLLLIWRSMVVAREARDRYGSLVAVGLATMFAFYAIINIGMVMGMMPATGLPLPFLSYGGSSMVSSLWAMGILFSIQIRRFTH